MTMRAAIKTVLKQVIQTGDHNQGVEDIMLIFSNVMLKLLKEE